jgi:predicted negative regulator of RcsB-dependent stress response
VESYRTEEEQVEALRRWWDENGRSTLVAIAVVLAGTFGWRAWQDHGAEQRARASDIYQAMVQLAQAGPLDEEQRTTARSYAEQLKAEHEGTAYAQFAALQLARSAVEAGELERAEQELRWVLARADRGDDVARVTELRLARVLAARGELEQALAILEQADAGPYAGAYALARGDVLMAMERNEEATRAYALAQSLGGGVMPGQSGTVDQKLQSLNPVPARQVEAPPAAADGAGEEAGDAAPATAGEGEG